jgi:hypothetical protein
VSVDPNAVNFLIVDNNVIDMMIELTIKLEEIARNIILLYELIKGIMNQSINYFIRKPYIDLFYNVG